jgi:two-component system, NtrC family, response regulator AtoC
VPPLRERRDEIPLLAAWFLARFNAQYGRRKVLTPDTLARLMEYSWSGNVRELENVIRRLVVLSDGDQALEALLARGRTGSATRGSSHGLAAATVRPIASESLRDIARRGARDAERKALLEVLELVHWNRAEASRILKVSYKTLLNKIVECGLTPPSRRAP